MASDNPRDWDLDRIRAARPRGWDSVWSRLEPVLENLGADLCRQNERVNSSTEFCELPYLFSALLSIYERDNPNADEFLTVSVTVGHPTSTAAEPHRPVPSPPLAGDVVRATCDVAEGSTVVLDGPEVSFVLDWANTWHDVMFRYIDEVENFLDENIDLLRFTVRSARLDD